MIDVLLPFYGDPALMRLTVRSVQSQSSPHFRLVVVDDGYPGPEVARWFADLEDPRVEYHRNPTNLGANLNYMRALELATAEQVVVMGADDLMLPGYLAAMEAAYSRFPDASVATCGVAVVDGEGRLVRPLVDRIKSRIAPTVSAPTLLHGESLMTSLLVGNWTYFPSLCWRTEVVRELGFRPDFHVVQDLGLLMDVLMRGGSMALMPEVAFHYRRHAGSDSAVKTLGGSRFEEEKRYFRTVAAELRDRGWPNAARAARLHLTSRLHSAALLPAAGRTGDLGAVGRLLRHATG